MKKEKEYLASTIDIINDEIREYEEQLEKLKSMKISFEDAKRGEHFNQIAKINTALTRINKLNIVKSSPYFGRIDFEYTNSNKKEKLYIGKIGITKDGHIVTTDWRSPICSMYYDNNIGSASYKVNDKEFCGNITLKRQYIIENGELLDVKDASILGNDEILESYLEGNADNRLKSIVASIQKEQNQIIRTDNGKNIIIQGVAGSGKTTIALHRIAYLIYNLKAEDKQNQFMIIGPNKYFLNYISSVLPDLDVSDVSQYTFLDLVSDYIDENLVMENQNDTIEKVMNKKIDTNSLSFKSSLKYRELINSFLDNYISEVFTKPFVFMGEELISLEKIQDILKYSNNGSLQNTINNYIKSFTNYIKGNETRFTGEMWNRKKEEYLSFEKGSKERKEIDNFLNEYRKNLKLGCNKQLKQFFKPLLIKTTEIYKQFIKSIDEYSSELEDININNFKKQSLNVLNKKRVQYEDLPALMQIAITMNKKRDFDKINHIAIDEAQDYNLFQFKILKDLFRNGNFSIFGDLAQSIYSYSSVDNWKDVIKIIFDNHCDLLNVNKSYRTTAEITNSANSVISYLNYKKADPVLRHGEDVCIEKIDNNKVCDYLLKDVNTFFEKGYKSIAIICKDEKATDDLYNELINSGIHIDRVANDSKEYNGALSIMPAYLSKGLEFDGVIIPDASEDIYSSNQKIDMKLLYVSMTRPLHELKIYYSKELTKPLNINLKKTQAKTKVKTL